MLLRSVIAGLLACLLSTACLAQADLVTPKDVTDSAVPRMVPFCPVGTTGKYAACSTTNPLPVFGGGGASTVAGSQEQDVRSSQTLNAATLNAAITLALNGQGTVGFTFTGLTGSGATLTYEQSNDGGTTWTGINEVNAGTGVPAATRTADGQTRVSVSGRTGVRVRVSTAGTGTITVATNVSVREGIVTLGSSLPPGANIIGKAGIDQTTPGAGGTNAVSVIGIDGSTQRQILVTTSGALEPPTCASAAKCPPWFAPLTANTSGQLLAANPQRIGLSIQCAGAAAVAVSETGAALTTATPAAGSGISLVIPSGLTPYFTPLVATRTAVTAYTGTGQNCWGTEYLR